jgi:hypothetical protein
LPDAQKYRAAVYYPACLWRFIFTPAYKILIVEASASAAMPGKVHSAAGGQGADPQRMRAPAAQRHKALLSSRAACFA